MAPHYIGRYRLAPKHRYPAAFEDCEIATKYLIKNADKFGVDPNRIAVIGEITLKTWFK